MPLKIPWKSLKQREWPYLAPFEYYLLYKEPHRGWVEYTGKGKEFRLRKSPFSPLYSQYTYVPPEDMAPPENAFIHVYGKERKRPRLKKKITVNGTKGISTIGEYEFWFEVEHWEIMKFEVLKPHSAELENYLEQRFGVRFEGMFTMKEMLYYLTLGWNDASTDGLDFTLGALYVSCPPNLYGSGGVGVQVYSLGGKKRVLGSYARYMERLMPKEFLRGHDLYTYANVRDTKAARHIESIATGTNELNMSYFGDVVYTERKLRPVHIPLILASATPRKVNDALPPDLLAYQLTALMIRPVVKESALREFEDNIRYVGKVMRKNDDLESKIDLSTVNRLSEAITRMRLASELSEESFTEARDRFMAYYMEYLEYKDRLSPFLKGGKMDGARVNVSYLHYHLTRSEINVLLTIMRLWEEEYAKEWVPMDRLRAEIKDPTLVDGAISLLQDYGYIIQKMNYAYIRPVVAEEEFSELSA